ncbi:MAG: hypothetical protein PHW80_09425 [Smithellaceae bacterium]|jgi:hypothetical protein|nr:hypothetical protein [Smithellaceae bacterium]MDD3259380.1 hypothetical protein [Smithellaceae bacterium]MDD3849507.1 hypothetical protein [Smithellaceae bacterium]HOG12646.1 hypothetical protein [Smithellaceae bacterium]HOQ71963.1 hypothetical protein [Smithellaceae bacterium]
MIHKAPGICFFLIAVFFLASCAGKFGSEVLSSPDEYRHVYEAKEKYILKAIAGVLEEKKIGHNVVIDYANYRVDSDYVVSGDWRTKTSARVRRLNWKECEVTLIVTTEKKTDNGWEMRRLLKKEQYDNFFSVIELKTYEEMSRIY